MNITAPIRRNARIAPHAPALLHFSEILSYAQLDAVLDTLAARFGALSLAPGQHAGIILSDRRAQLLFALALARMGVTAVLSHLPARGAQGPAVTTCFVDAATAPDFPGGTVVDDGWMRAPAAAGGQKARPAPMHEGGAATCIVVYSSGTTGAPKAVAMSHDLLRARVEGRSLAMRLPSPTRQVCLMPPDSAYGFHVVLRTLWTGGLAVTAIGGNALAASIALHGVNHLLVSSMQLGTLLQSFPAQASPFPSLQMIEVGGSAPPARLASEARARFCPHLHITYGAAECGYAAGADAAALEQRPDAVGFIAPDTEVQAVDDMHRALPAGAEGMLRIRNAACVREYLGDPEATARAFRDGWFYPGDVGSVSEDGMLIVAGRRGEIINAGGVKVSPRRVEEVLLENPDVAEAAAFALQNAATGLDEIWAAIVPKQPFDLNPLHLHCMKRLGPAAPVSIVTLDRLPRNERGKVLNDELVRAVEALRGRAT